MKYSDQIRILIMQIRMKLNGDDIRFFLAIARARSMTAAARELGVSQPTVSRRLAAMEARLGVRLFARARGGYQPSAAGRDILETAKRIEADLSEIDRKVSGRDRRLNGRLRVTCTETLASRYLSAPIGRFLAAHPGIELTLLGTFAPLSLSRREADLAIRFTWKPPDTYLGRRLARAAFGLYGAGPSAARPPAERDWIGWQDEAYNRRLITAPFPSARIKHRTDSLETMCALTRDGRGIAALPCYLADPDPTLRRVRDQVLWEESPDLWLLTHPDMRRVARVRRFGEAIAEAVVADRDLFEGHRIST